mmetsp:Transcript_28969/g.70644  ORF Transcript_28969/g.70644 Transcript_28969/m.70644 type:complete len:591 (-) Transcript_28969:217-1989(-)|eukprot:CAMPEP_0114488130 /NCGR_PEP_ID=MMETSP0109-20121206/1153_1 /TAXON_ID=29199 /ORGANISM="Chlorarachnion reptans, Strain CCCM449" /LENGTH=590 /DNA_ID=CAMNT_0001664477 /DNA_START=223 /DNA_END=1995 /DNA_ORIENTATION=+
MDTPVRFLYSLLLVLFSVLPVEGGESSHKYERGEDVTVWVNKIGPFHNPQETYPYDSLGLCKEESKIVKRKSQGFAGMLTGDNLVDSGISMQFQTDIEDKAFCKMILDGDNIGKLTSAVEQHYWYQMYIDDLPVWGMIGELMMPEGKESGDEQAFIYTHKAFTISYNHKRVIEINLTSEKPVALKKGSNVQFTYSVKWTQTSKVFSKRFDRYLDSGFFEHKIHWFSVFNSVMMVVFLCGLVSLILMRVLRSDYTRYSLDDEEIEMDRMGGDETGWKLIHGDVFSRPKFLELYASLIGTGYQLFVLTFWGILICVIGALYTMRGSIQSMVLICYAITSFINGYTGGSFYKRYGGKFWKNQFALSGFLFPGIALSIVVFLNMTAIMYESQAAISLTALLAVIGIWMFISMPLLFLGTLIGKNMTEELDFPCRPSRYRRPIPAKQWFTHPFTLASFGGILPFGSIFIEMYYAFTSFWNYKFYYVYGFLFLVYCILIVVTICVTIVCTYFLLNAEDYRWQWTTFLAGGSTAGYVFLYAIYFFFNKTHMYGLMQTAFYFGYTAIFCIGLFILTGTIAYIGTSIFVHKIYYYIKSD